MSKKYLDSNGLLYFWRKIQNMFALKSDVPGPATDSPKMDGTTAIGSSAKYAREDHVHPTDTSRVPTTRTVNGHALSANVTVTKGDVGLGNVDNTADASKKVASAGKLTAAANIDGVDFDGSADVVRYGVCSTAAGTAAKTVTLEGSTPFKLVTGASVFVKFSATNSAAVNNLTLNVNGTGAKAIKRYGTTNMAAVGNLTAGMVCQFVYDGTNWLWVGHVNTDTTYSNASLGQGYGTCDTADGTTAKVVSLSSYALASGGIVAVQFNQHLKSGIYTLNINSKGAKPVIYENVTATSSVPVKLPYYESASVGIIHYFMYNGTGYVYLGTDRGVEVSNADLGHFYGRSTTASTTKEKVVMVDSDYGEFDLKYGAFLHVYFLEGIGKTYTITITGLTDPIVIKYEDVAATPGGIRLPCSGVSYVTHTFFYDGEYFIYVGCDHETEYSAATTSAAGLMSANDKKKVTNMNCFFNSTTTGGKTKYSLEIVSGSGEVVEASKTYFYSRNDIDGMKGAANGLCPLDSSSKIDSAYLPSYVDDIIEAYARSGQEALSQNWLATGSASGTVITPEAGKIYVLMADSGSYSANSQFRWSGTAYVKLNDGGVSEITNTEIDTIVAS